MAASLAVVARAIRQTAMTGEEAAPTCSARAISPRAWTLHWALKVEEGGKPDPLPFLAPYPQSTHPRLASVVSSRTLSGGSQSRCWRRTPCQIWLWWERGTLTAPASTMSLRRHCSANAALDHNNKHRTVDLAQVLPRCELLKLFNFPLFLHLTASGTRDRVKSVWSSLLVTLWFEAKWSWMHPDLRL